MSDHINPEIRRKAGLTGTVCPTGPENPTERSAAMNDHTQSKTYQQAQERRRQAEAAHEARAQRAREEFRKDFQWMTETVASAAAKAEPPKVTYYFHPKRTALALISVLAYIGTIVAANWMTDTFGLVPIGFGLLVTAGTFAAGLALIARDWVQTTSGPVIVIGAILVGAAISYFTSNPALAVASGVAFLTAELVDMGVFTPLRRRNLPTAVVVSSVVAAPIDTVLFLWLAGFPVTWQAVLGQFLVKTALALVVAAVLAARGRRVAMA